MDIEKIKEEVKSRILIGDVLRQRGVQVNANGQFSSPFREDKNPSCSWKKSTNRWKDFTNGDGGDVIELHMQLYNLEFMPALRELAASINIDMDPQQLPGNTKPTPAAAAQPTPAVKFSDMLDKALIGALDEEEAIKYFHILGSNYDFDNDHEVIIGSDLYTDIKITLMEIKSGMQKERIQNNTIIFEDLYNYCTKSENINIAALKYLTNTRKLNIDSINELKIFTINDYQKVKNHLIKAFTLEELQQSGLFNQKKMEDGSIKSNLIFFNHRIIIPYLWNNKISYMRGRYFDKDGNSNSKQFKYLGLINDALAVNTPKRFYNLSVIDKMLDGQKLFTVEGELDVVAMHSLQTDAIGIPGVGNMPDPEHFVRLLRFKNVICVDDDDAGKGLKNKLIAIFKKYRNPIYIKLLPGNANDVNAFLMVDDDR